MGLTRPLSHREAMRGGPKGSAASRQPPKRPAFRGKPRLACQTQPGWKSCLYRWHRQDHHGPQAGLTKTHLGGEGTCMGVPAKNEEQKPV